MLVRCTFLCNAHVLIGRRCGLLHQVMRRLLFAGFFSGIFWMFCYCFCPVFFSPYAIRSLSSTLFFTPFLSISPFSSFALTWRMHHFWLCFRTARNSAHKHHSISTFSDLVYHKLNSLLHKREFRLNKKRPKFYARFCLYCGFDGRSRECEREKENRVSASPTFTPRRNERADTNKLSQMRWFKWCIGKWDLSHTTIGSVTAASSSSSHHPHSMMLLYVLALAHILHPNLLTMRFSFGSCEYFTALECQLNFLLYAPTMHVSDTLIFTRFPSRTFHTSRFLRSQSFYSLTKQSYD